jgi:hypothetical protein
MNMFPYSGGGGGGGGISIQVDSNRFGTCRMPGCREFPATNTDFCNIRTCDPSETHVAALW